MTTESDFFDAEAKIAQAQAEHFAAMADAYRRNSLVAQGRDPDELDDELPQPIVWTDFFADVSSTRWLVEGLWPVGRSMTLHAKPKVGKSLLMLWIAVKISQGICPLTGEAQEPIATGYLDYEMTRDDLRERLESMGETPGSLSELRYYQFPTISPLDTSAGGEALLALVQRDGVEALCIDTMAGAIDGEENSADTFAAANRHTFAKLKAAGISVARVDHEGHGHKRERGSSAKGAGPDVGWGLSADGSGMILTQTYARLQGMPPVHRLRRVDAPHLAFHAVESTGVPPGTADLVRQLDELGIDPHASRNATRTALAEAGIRVRNDRLGAAIKARREPRPVAKFEPVARDF